VSKFEQIIAMLLQAADDEQTLSILEDDFRMHIKRKREEMGLVPAGGLMPQLHTPQAAAVQMVMNQLPPALPKVQPQVTALPYTGVGIAYINAMNNNGGLTRMQLMVGGEFQFQGLMVLKIHPKLEIKLSHQLNVPNLVGCSFAEAIINGYPIQGSNVIDTPAGTFSFASTSGKVGSPSHSFYRESKGSPLLIVTMQGTFAILTNVLFQSDTSPLG